MLSLLISFGVHAASFTVRSHALVEGQPMKIDQVFGGMGCTGKNISPDLAWEHEPAGTKSFAVLAFDPDAPTGSGWWHWSVFDLPPSVKILGPGASHHLPKGAREGRTDFGAPGYGGACPPPGDKPHHYIFTVYALKVDKLDVPPDASPAMVSFFARQHALAQAAVTVTYQRAK